MVLLANKEDVALAVLTNSIQNIASMTVWTALAKNCRTVYVCGGVFEHQLPRHLFFYFFQGLAMLHGKVNYDAVCISSLLHRIWRKMTGYRAYFWAIAYCAHPNNVLWWAVLTVKRDVFVSVWGCTHRGRTGPAEPLLRTTATTNMAAPNFVVITNGRAYWNSRYRPIACHVLSFRELRLVVDCR